MRLACLALALAQPVVAETRLFACDFGPDRSVEVTLTGTTATYAFRHPTNSLTLNRPVTQVHLTPWPGIGRTIWEEIAFQNAGYTYRVFASIERIPPADDEGDISVNVAGGIVVLKDETRIVGLDCTPGTVDFPWGNELFDAKRAAGQCYDRAEARWDAC